MDIKVLISGCTNCKNTVALRDQVAKAQGVDIALEKVDDMRAIMAQGVMGRDKVEQWLAV